MEASKATNLNLGNLCKEYEWLYDPFLVDGDFVLHTTGDFAHDFDRLPLTTRWNGLCRLLKAVRKEEYHGYLPSEWEFLPADPERWEVLISEFDKLAREAGCFVSPGQLSLLGGKEWE